MGGEGRGVRAGSLTGLGMGCFWGLGATLPAGTVGEMGIGNAPRGVSLGDKCCARTQGAAGSPGLVSRGNVSQSLPCHALGVAWGSSPAAGWVTVLAKVRASIWCLGWADAAHGVLPGLASPWRGALVLQGYLLLVHRLADVAPYLICISLLERGVSPLFISLFMMHIN